MRNAIFLLFSILVIFSSCDKENDTVPTCEDCNFTCLDQSEPNVYSNECQDNWECGFKVFSQSAIDLNENLGVVNGDKNVFQMVRSTEGDDAIADDEFTNILVFDLDESQNSFSVDDGDLANMNVHYRTFCFCSTVDFRPVTIGCLQGEKQADGTWFVQGYFEEVEGPETGFKFGINAQFEN